MSDPTELHNNLETYKAQLKQVEAALMIDADNDELKNLKKDLEEVIALTLDLVSMNEGPSAVVATKEEESSDIISLVDTKIILDCKWKVGDKCQAPWSKEDRYYNATIDMISEDKTTCTVVFDKYDTTETVTIPSLRSYVELSVDDTRKRTADAAKLDKPGGAKPSRAEIEKKKEQKRKKLLKKQQRMKEFEEQREREKNKWLDFYNGGAKGKGRVKGLNKKSIFASPEGDQSLGKVGVGTCGIGGRAMTKFTNPTQYIYKK